jgi:hypothetical protein
VAHGDKSSAEFWQRNLLMIVALVAVLLLSAVATGTYVIWQLMNGHGDPPPKPTPSISPSSSASRTPASTRSAATPAVVGASSRPIQTGTPSAPAETAPSPDPPDPAEPAPSQAGPDVSPSSSLSPAFDVQVALDPDRVTLHVVILGAPPGSRATTAIDGHRCGPPVKVTPSGTFDVDSRGCGVQRFGDASLVRVAVTAEGRPVGQSIIEVERILDSPRKAVRGIVTGLLGGR